MAVEYAQSTKAYSTADFTVSTAGFTSPATGDLYLLFMSSGDAAVDGDISEKTTTDWTDFSFRASVGGTHTEVWIHERGAADPGLTFARGVTLLVETILVRIPAADWSGDVADIEVATSVSTGTSTTIDFPATAALINADGIGFTFCANSAGAGTGSMTGPTEKYDLVSDAGYLQTWFGEETGLAGAAYNPGVLTVDEGNLVAMTLGVSGPAASATTALSGTRWFDDDGSESGATALAAQDTAITGRATETNTRLRVQIQTTGDVASGGYKLQFRKVGDPTWQDIA